MSKPSPKTHRPEYFEAIIQLRPAKTRLVEYVLTEIEKDKNCDICKVTEIKKGIDIFITSRRFVMALKRKLKKRFDGEAVLSRQLHTQDKLTSKLVYRITLLFRLKE